MCGQTAATAKPARSGSLLAALHATGYKDMEVEDIIRLKDNGVNAAFLYELFDSGVKELRPEELIRLRQNGISVRYLREIRAATPGVSVEEVIEFHNGGVKPALPAAIQKQGFGPYSAREVIAMSQHGVESSFLEALKEFGITRVEARDVIRARDHGVDRSTLRRAPKGLSISQIVRMKSAGEL